MVGFLMGLVPSWWNDKHNQKHHRNPNRIGEDSDIDVSVLSFIEASSLGKTGLLRLMVKYQAFLFVPIFNNNSHLLLIKNIRNNQVND